MDGFPSGQRERTVNPLSQTSMVRIHPHPPSISPLQEWRNWQTRTVQVRVRSHSCRFKSCFLHQKKKVELIFAFFFVIVTIRIRTDYLLKLIDFHKKDRITYMNWFEERSKKTYNELAAGYDASFEGEYTTQFKTLLLNAVTIQPYNHVLDIACGNGRLLNMFAKQNQIHGYGVDIADQMIKHAKQLNPNMHFSVGNCERIPLPDQSMDIITVCAAYHHFPHVDLFARESFRLMKAGGRIYIAEVYYPSAIRLLTNPFLPLHNKGDVKIYSPAAISSTLMKAGYHEAEYSIHGHIQIVSARK